MDTLDDQCAAASATAAALSEDAQPPSSQASMQSMSKDTAVALILDQVTQPAHEGADLSSGLQCEFKIQEELRRQRKTNPHTNLGKGTTLIPGPINSSTTQKRSLGTRRVAGLT